MWRHVAFEVGRLIASSPNTLLRNIHLASAELLNHRSRVVKRINQLLVASDLKQPIENLGQWGAALPEDCDLLLRFFDHYDIRSNGVPNARVRDEICISLREEHTCTDLGRSNKRASNVQERWNCQILICTSCVD